MIIYKTTNLVNGKIYVGAHKTSINDGYLGSGINLKDAIKEFGKDKFKRETLEVVNKNNWREKEINWIEKLDSTNPKMGYNIARGGNGS